MQGESIKVLDHGLVRLVDMMPNENSVVGAVTSAARVSYYKGTEEDENNFDKMDQIGLDEKNRGLYRFLYRHNHSSPIEMVVFKFHLVLPLFVFAHFVRHRTASLNCVSARYTVLKDRFYVPGSIRKQSKNNHQSSSGDLENEELLTEFQEACLSEEVYEKYESFIERGVPREQARMILPQNIYTECYWQMDLRNLLHFLDLRLDEGAQLETRLYAEAIAKIVKEKAPIVYEAFEDFNRGSVTLHQNEINAINNGTLVLEGVSKGEQREFDDKLKKLNIKSNN